MTLDGSETPRRLTHGHRDASPDVSADGRRVAFTRAEPQGRAQVHVLELDRGEPVQLTDEPLGATDPVFSPDGSRVAYLARVPEKGRLAPGGDAAAEAPRHITSLQIRSDGLGFVADRRRHVLVVDVPAELADPVVVADVPRVQLTAGDIDLDSPRWLPGGTHLVATAAVHDGRDQDLRSDVVLVDARPRAGSASSGAHLAGSRVPELRRLTAAGSASDLAIDTVRVSPDGSRLWLIAADMGSTGRDFIAAHRGLFALDLVAGADGQLAAGQPRRLTDPETTDLVAGVLVAVGEVVLVAGVHRGAVRLLEVASDAGTVRPVLGAPLVVHGIAATRDGTQAVVTFASPGSAGEVGVVDLAGGQVRVVSDWSEQLRATGRIRAPRELAATAPDGVSVHGWVVGPDPDRFGDGPHPTILLIHGGPHAQFTYEVFDEVQVLAEAGYAVVFGNPRGSAGYGAAHGRAIRQRLGTVDADDVLALLDAALADPTLDGARVGVMGGSYGGYLAAWLTTRSQRFVAAIVERGFLDPSSFVGSSDIGWFFAPEYVGDTALPGGAELVAAQSPMAHVGDVQTPTLVIHSEQDWRCPVEQGQRWFVELKRRGVPTELLLFPGEGHELTRSGRPSHRVARFEHVLAWWARYLPV